MNEHAKQLAQETSEMHPHDGRSSDDGVVAEKAADAASDLYVAFEKENRRLRFDLAMERAATLR